MKTTAAVLYELDKPFEVTEIDLKEPSTGEVLVELEATGICRTDEHARVGSMPNPVPAVLGHEGAGVVKEVGPGVSSLKVGDHVVLVWMPACGKCEPCRSGLGQLCVRGAGLLEGFMLDGKTRMSKGGKDLHHYFFLSAFSKHVVVPEEGAVKITEKAALNRACLLGCALTAGFGAVTRTANQMAGCTGAVFGFGGIGSGAINGLKACNARTIIVVDPNDWKEEYARKMGADYFINPKKEDPVAAILDITNGIGVDSAYDAWGSVEVEGQCYSAIRNKGKAIYLGGPHHTENQIPINALSICLTEKQMLGSLYGSCVPQVEVPKFAELFAQGKMDLDTPVTKTWTLDQINEGFDAMRNGEVIRGVIEF